MAGTDNDASPPHPDPARLLELSDERDQWQRHAEAMWRDGYAAACVDAFRRGYEQAVREWKITAAGLTCLGGPRWEDLDRRRYPPGGRQSWIAGASDRGEPA